MKNHLALAALATALIATPAAAQLATPTPTIAVSGEATVSVPPDLALIDGGVSSQAGTAREAAAANNAAMGKVLLAIKQAGIDDKDVQTARLSLQPVYTQAPNKSGDSAITGYRASNRVTLRLRDIGKVAATIDTLVAAGANEIGGISFTVAQPSKLLDDARADAIADARRKAEIYAQAAGVTLGAPVSIAEDSSSAPAPTMFRKMSGVAAAAPVAQGEETLRVSVSVSWEIKPKS
jgi:hypothetical protein